MTLNVETWLCGPPPASGQRQQFPSRFLNHLLQRYPEFIEGRTLQMFSGASRFLAASSVTTDLRPESGADHVCPFDAVPLPDRSFDAVLADPPYADHYAKEWHADLPRPKHVLREARRLVRRGGLVGILHIIIIPAYKELGVARVGLHPVLAGPNNAIRVFNVFRRWS